MNANTVFKLIRHDLWQQALADGVFKGAAIDLSDGYIHFSTASQLDGTARKFFSGQDDLVLLEVDLSEVADDLRWEPSRGGDLFPHLYAPMPLSTVRSERRLSVDGDGEMQFEAPA
jgi:Uncharacterized protein conserved in bacteria